ncbi:MAG: hypothetical protein AAFR36_06150 [Bacteroidota bacterium]
MSTDFFSSLVQRYDELKLALLHAQTFDPQHFGFPPVYYEIMESDQQRVGAYARAFAQLDLSGKVVCEAGVGRLALTELYLPYVDKAYLIETNPQLFPYIEAMVEKKGWSDRVELLFTDAREVQLPEAVDLVIGEMMSIFCANEFQVQVFQHLRQYLNAKGQLIPGKIINLAQLARVDFPEKVDHYPINFTRHWPELLSSEVSVNTIDLYAVQDEPVQFRTPVIPLLSGEVNALLLRSYVELLPGVNFTGTDSLMPPTVFRLATPKTVTAGRSYLLEGRFKYGTSLDEAVMQLVE